MFAAVPMFIGSEKLAAFAIKCLAVGGAFLVGYALGGVITWALNKWVFAEKAPDIAKKAVRALAGLALAILVALIVFGDGSGGGLFGGGADGSGKGSPDADSQSKDKGDKTPPVTPPDKVPKVDVPGKSPDIPADSPRVRVVFYGGSKATNDRFYQIDDDPGLKTFAELQEAILEKKKQADRRQMYLQVQFPADPTVAAAESSFTVTQVTDWARGNGIEVRWPGKK